MDQDLGAAVQDLGVMDQNLGAKVQYLGVVNQDLGAKVQYLGVVIKIFAGAPCMRKRVFVLVCSCSRQW